MLQLIITVVILNYLLFRYSVFKLLSSVGALPQEHNYRAGDDQEDINQVQAAGHHAL